LEPIQGAIMQQLQLSEQNMQGKLETCQDALTQRMDFQQVSMMQTLNNSLLLLHKLDSSQESTQQKLQAHHSLMVQIAACSSSLETSFAGSQETVAASANAMLQKLDSTQQELVKECKESNVILQSVATSQTVMTKKIDAGQEAAKRSGVEMEGKFSQSLREMGEQIKTVSSKDHETLQKSLRSDLAMLAEQGNATVEAYEKTASEQSERMADVRRQNMMIMDMLTATSEHMQTSADTVKEFTRSEVVRASQTNSEFNLRDMVMHQMQQIKEQIGGEGQSGQIAMLETVLERLDQLRSSVGKSETSGASVAEMEEAVRREMSAVALVLAQSTRETSQEQFAQVSETFQQFENKVGEFAGAVDKNVKRFEAGVDKVVNQMGNQTSQSRRKSMEERG